MTTNRVTRVAAYGLLTKNDNILLCRISDHISSHAGMWTLPGGGIEFGENPTDAMIREVQEETGLIVEPTVLAGIDSICVDARRSTYHNIRIIYRTNVLGGTLANELDGTTDLAKWWPMSEATNLVDLAQVGIRLVLEH